MPKDNRNFFEKKKDWSEIKDTLLGAYLKPYFQKILMTRHPVFYVDCFSGKGRFDDGKPGSPIIALNVRKECMASTKLEKASIDMCFIDLNYAPENMLKRTDELVLNIQREGQMSIFDFMSDVSTDSSGEQTTIYDVKKKMYSYLQNYKGEVHLNKLILSQSVGL